MTESTYSSNIVDAALCIWEHALDDCSAHSDSKIYDWLRQGEGAATGRDNAVTLAPFAEHAWKRANGLGYDAAFDWEFVPLFCAHAMEKCSAACYLTDSIAEHIGETIYIEGPDS